ncbi:hypothetical protein PAEPH01_0274 [Pancytospora epiphaga]|nr:hypothetical protein PAEPH01_0274 [Pancytospora epiphaga]
MDLLFLLCLQLFDIVSADAYRGSDDANDVVTVSPKTKQFASIPDEINPLVQDIAKYNLAPVQIVTFFAKPGDKNENVLNDPQNQSPIAFMIREVTARAGNAGQGNWYPFTAPYVIQRYNEQQKLSRKAACSKAKMPDCGDGYTPVRVLKRKAASSNNSGNNKSNDEDEGSEKKKKKNDKESQDKSKDSSKSSGESPSKKARRDADSSSSSSSSSSDENQKGNSNKKNNKTSSLIGESNTGVEGFTSTEELGN